MNWVYRAFGLVSIVVLGVLAVRWFLHQAHPAAESGTYQWVTGDNSEEDRNRWDALYSTQVYLYGKEPEPFLRRNVDRLPVGRALDIAMAEGRNAVFLAKKGFQVEGVDISEVALRKARRLARENHVTVTTINADLRTYSIRPETYDVIVNINYLQRSLIPQIKRGLKRGGYVVFQNHTVDQLKNPGGKSVVREYLLEKEELRRMFSDFEEILYEEVNDGQEARASLLARKP